MVYFPSSDISSARLRVRARQMASRSRSRWSATAARRETFMRGKFDEEARFAEVPDRPVETAMLDMTVTPR